MTDENETPSYSTNPAETDIGAYRVGAFPKRYSDRQRHLLMDRGYALLLERDDIESDKPVRRMVRELGKGLFGKNKPDKYIPLFDDPGELAIATAFVSTGLVRHDEIRKGDLSGVIPLSRLAERYAYNFHALLHEYEYRDQIMQEIGEMVYEKEGEHPGRVCEGVVYPDDLPGGIYMKIPMPAASKKCLVYYVTDEEGDEQLHREYVPEEKDSRGTLASEMKDNAAYVPYPDCREKHMDHLEQTYGELGATLMQMMSSSDKEKLLDYTQFLRKEVDKIVRAGKYDLLYENYDPNHYFTEMIKEAINASPDLSLGEGHTAKEIHDAIDKTSWDDERMRNTAASVSSPQSLGPRLSKIAADSDKIAKEETREWESDKYRYSPRHNANFEPVTITEPADFFELPCFNAMDERLQDRGPVRDDLFPFVSNMRWLSQYRTGNDPDDVDVDAIIDDMKSLFDGRYPWYKPDVTEYQVRYELEHGGVRSDDGSEQTPLPRGCDHESMQRYCIGKDVCPYSIYHSINWDEDMWTELESRNG